MIVRSYFAVLLLCTSTLVAESVTSRNGNILYIDGSGRERQITSGHDDRDPSLSPDGQHIVFVRASKTEPSPIHPKETRILVSELWYADQSGRMQPAVIFRGSVMPPDGRPLTVFSSPQFSPGDKYVFFLAEFSATSDALCRLDVSRHRASFLTGGAIQYALLTNGGHRGRMIASMRTTPTHPEGGYFYPFYLLDAQGRRLRRIADESADLRSLVRQYSSSSR